MSVIAVFGGTFNPFHIGHYEMLSYLCGLGFIDKVLVMPDNIPPHKSCDYLADDVDRIEMCNIVCQDFKKAEICLIEFEREGKSYTLDTLKILTKKYPEDKFYTVIGGDMLATLDEWHNWQELLKITSFIVFERDGYDDFEYHLDRMRKLGANIFVASAEITDVSSTELRHRLNKKLLPEKVYDYIIKKGTYDV